MKNARAKNIIQQVSIWGMGWLIVLLILGNGGELDKRFWVRALLMIIGSSIVVFINLRWLLPKLYFRNMRGRYLLSSAILLAIIVWCVHSDLLPWNSQEWQGINRPKAELNLKKKNYSNNTDFIWLLRNLPPLFISLLGSSLVSVSRFAREKEKEAISLERAKLETEIKFLKSQINPHFLFNSLNNIYALTIIQSDSASEQLLKLSDILRYMLYDSNEERVPLQRELVYLKNYLSLAQLKDSRGMDVRFDVEGENSSMMIAPLLFIPIVENAFKHSQIEDLKNGYIHIILKVLSDQLIFEIKNSKAQREYKKDELGGIGLSNVKQRLSLLYPGKHHLEIKESMKDFKVYLRIDCS